MKRPNILLIVSDQHRYDCIGYAGRYPVQTPALDRLAADGVCFENAYTAIPTCCPARQSFYAARRPESFGAYWNYGITLPVGTLPPDDYCVMRDFANSGYTTSLLGHWEVSDTHSPQDYGYVRYANPNTDYTHDTGVSSHGPVTGWVDTCPCDKTQPAYMADRAIAELQTLAEGDAPFFLTVNFPQPHPPCHPHESFYALYREVPPWDGADDDLQDKPFMQRQMVANWGNTDKLWADWEPVVRRYYAAISEIDHHVGRIVDALDALGLAEDTVVVYTADHGDTCGDHGMFDKHYILYDCVCRVPLIIRYGHHLAPRRTADFTVHTLDLGLTLLDLAGVPCTAEVTHGHSLCPVLQGGKGTRQEAVSTFNGAQFGLYTLRSIRTDGWRYVWNTGDIDELYCEDEDPGEVHNRIADPACADILADLRARLFEVLKAEGDALSALGDGYWVGAPHLKNGRKLDT